MASVYILHSVKLDHFYIGSCLNINERLIEHKQKTYDNSFTAKANDWKLFVSIDELGYKQARSIEKHIKRMKSKAYIDNLVKYPQIIEKLKLKYAAGLCR